MSLHPTPTRLHLLRAVAVGRVYHEAPEDDGVPGGDFLYHGKPQKVTARCAELRRAGWIEPPPMLNLGTHYRAESGPWRITDAGRLVLDAASTKGGAS